MLVFFASLQWLSIGALGFCVDFVFDGAVEVFSLLRCLSSLSDVFVHFALVWFVCGVVVLRR